MNKILLANGHKASKEASDNGFLKATRKTRNATTLFSAPFRNGSRKIPILNGRNNSLQPTLTSRQTEVIRWIADGYSTRKIAEFLRLSPKTVEKHRQALMKKLGIHNIALLTRYAVSSGIVASYREPNLPPTTA